MTDIQLVLVGLPGFIALVLFFYNMDGLSEIYRKFGQVANIADQYAGDEGTYKVRGFSLLHWHGPRMMVHVVVKRKYQYKEHMYVCPSRRFGFCGFTVVKSRVDTKQYRLHDGKLQPVLQSI